MENIEGVLLDPMSLVQIMLFAGDRVEGRGSICPDLEAPEPLLDGRVPALPKKALGVCGSIPRLREADRGIGALRRAVSSVRTRRSE